MALESTSILIVEDDAILANRLSAAFASRRFDVRSAGTAAEAERLAREDPPELVVLDLRVGQDNGLALIPALKAIDPATSIVVLTGYGSIATAVEAVKRGATQYLTKPADADQILSAFGSAPGGVGGSGGRVVRPGDPEPPGETQTMTLDRVEWEHINRVLVEHGGNISEAARALGLHRRTLQRKLAKYPSAR